MSKSRPRGVAFCLLISLPTVLLPTKSLGLFSTFAYSILPFVPFFTAFPCTKFATSVSCFTSFLFFFCFSTAISIGNFPRFGHHYSAVGTCPPSLPFTSILLFSPFFLHQQLFLAGIRPTSISSIHFHLRTCLLLNSSILVNYAIPFPFLPFIPQKGACE